MANAAFISIPTNQFIDPKTGVLTRAAVAFLRDLVAQAGGSTDSVPNVLARVEELETDVSFQNTASNSIADAADFGGALVNGYFVSYNITNRRFELSAAITGAAGSSTNVQYNDGSGNFAAATFTVVNTGNDIKPDATNGMKIGTSTSDKLGFFNATPVVQRSAYTQTYATAVRTHNNFVSTDVATTASTNITPYGYTTAAQADDIVTQINNIRDDIENVKQLINSLIDDSQTLGFAG